MNTRAILILVILLQTFSFNFPAFAEASKVWRRGDPPPKDGWSWPKLETVFIYSEVKFAENGNYEYTYTIFNPSQNKFPLYRFEVDLRNNPKEHPFTREHFSLDHDIVEHKKKLEEALHAKTIRIIRPQNWNRPLPGKWEQKYANDPIWVADEPAVPAYQIQPGNKLSGLGLVAAEPPGIREFIVDAEDMEYFDAMPLQSLPPEKARLLANPDEYDLEINKGTTYSSKTIAPVAPPEPFTVSSWTARMEADAAEARTLGWIKTNKNLTEIARLIAGLRTDNLSKLKSAAETIEKYVQSEKKKGNLTGEADALIRLNAQYLLRRFETSETSK